MKQIQNLAKVLDGGLALFATLTKSLNYVLITVLAQADAIIYGFTIAGAVAVVLAATFWMGKLDRQIKPECTLANQC